MTDFNFSPLLFFQVIAMLGYFRFCRLLIWCGSALCVSPQISGALRLSAKLCQITVPNFYRCSSWLVDNCCRWGRFGHIRSRFEYFLQASKLSFCSLLVRQFRASLKFKEASVLGMGFEIFEWNMNRDSLLSESR